MNGISPQLALGRGVDTLLHQQDKAKVQQAGQRPDFLPEGLPLVWRELWLFVRQVLLVQEPRLRW